MIPELLTDNIIGDERGNILCEMLKVNTTLTVLFMRSE